MTRILRLTLLASVVIAGLTLGLAAVIAVIALVRYQLNDREIQLPRPRGNHAVGRRLVQWHDGACNRDLMIFIWYPARPGSTGERCAYLPGKWGEIEAENRLPIPAKRLREIRVSAIKGALVAPGRMPVLVMLPGMGRNPADYTTLAEDLASFGNLVVGVTPTGSTTVVFPNGITMPGRDFIPQAANDQVAQQLVAQWSQDASFALDCLTADPIFAPHILPTRVGVFGHSFGGNVALHLLKTDPRFARATDIDGSFFGEPLEHVSKPVMILGGVGDLGSQQRALVEDGVAGSRMHLFQNAKHMNFSDAGVLPSRFPIPKRLLMLGDVDGAALLYATSDQLRDFFDSN